MMVDQERRAELLKKPIAVLVSMARAHGFVARLYHSKRNIVAAIIKAEREVNNG